MRTLFVTGAEGFAGTHLVRALQGHGCEVVAGVRNRARKLAYEKQSRRALVCDVSDAINVARAIASVKPDGVIHLAGVARSDEAASDPLAAYQTLVTSTANILDAVRRVAPRARVLLISAGEVYGSAGAAGQPLPETTCAQPCTTFGAWKLAAESIAHTFFANYHLNVTIARPFGYTGPGQPDSFFFGAVARRLAAWDHELHGAELKLPDLSCRRDILHIDDVTSAYLRLFDDGKPNEIYNVCSGTATPVGTFVTTLARELGVDVRCVDAASGSTRSAIPVLCGAPERLTTELGWTPSRTWQDAARDLAASIQKHPVAI
jgi:GDP-4-dehydro-6-deoxy-D-mannose reductase